MTNYCIIYNYLFSMDIQLV